MDNSVEYIIVSLCYTRCVLYRVAALCFRSSRYHL